ncbi:UNC79, partial [Cordylochernes scorpioides]
MCLFFFLISTQQSYQGIKLVELVDGVCWGCVSSSFLSPLNNHIRVLDCNFKIGTILLATCLPLLVYCPSGSRAGQWGNQTLWLLSGPFRKAWLLAVIVILYKLVDLLMLSVLGMSLFFLISTQSYQGIAPVELVDGVWVKYNVSVFIILYKYDYDSMPFSKQVVMLVHTILNTLSCHHHHCRQVPAAPATTSPIPSRSRDLSATSVELENIHEPPEVLVSAAAPPKLPAEESPSSEELEAIPESPKSEPEDSSIVEKSNQESMEKVRRTDSCPPEYGEADEILTVTYDSSAHSSEVHITSEEPKREPSPEAAKKPAERPPEPPPAPIFPYISKPSLERLLPIGPLPPRRHLQECCYESDKAVQTMETMLGMEIPALERLLPVGPMPSRSTTPSPCTPASHKAKWTLQDIPLESPVHH